MGAATPERSFCFAGRTDVRRSQCHLLNFLLILSLAVGCRSTGTNSGSGTVSGSAAYSTTGRASSIDSDISIAKSALQKRRRKTLADQTPHSIPDSNPEFESDADDIDVAESKEPNSHRSLIRLAGDETVDGTTDFEQSRSAIKRLAFIEEGPEVLRQIAGQADVPNRSSPSTADSEPTLRLKLSADIPGADAAQILLPILDPDDPESIRLKQAAVDHLFPDPAKPKSIAVPTDRVMTLEELEELALQNSPIIAQASANIIIAQGGAIQAGVYPNPVVGYESDTVGSSFTKDYQGAYTSQVIKTAGKVPLQRAIANIDSMNSQLGFERTRIEVLRMVRAGYYSVLIAQESNRINEAMVDFNNQVYLIIKARVNRTKQAPYELSQLQSLLNQAKATLVTSQNRYIAAWKQLAIATGVPDLPRASLVGRVDMPLPNLDFDDLRARMMSVHPDLRAAQNMEEQAKLQLTLQKRIPIPDVTIAGVFQNDFTTPGFNRTAYNLNASVPVPIFDRNQGNIRAAEGRLRLNSQYYALNSNQLTNQLTDAFERFQDGRVLSEKYRAQILPDQVRAYYGTFLGHIFNSDRVAFGDIIIAQQNLANGLSSYLTALQIQWTAATDIANLLQLEDFRELFSDLPPAPEQPADASPSKTSREGGRP